MSFGRMSRIEQGDEFYDTYGAHELVYDSSRFAIMTIVSPDNGNLGFQWGNHVFCLLLL
jgi:hypothetical protein